MTFHKSLTGTDIHVPFTFTYANAAARTGATGFVAADVGKFARQSSDETYWVLTAVTPVWKELTGSGGGGGSAHLLAQVTNSDTTTNINTVGFTDVPINGNTDFLDTGYTISGDGLKVANANRYKATLNMFWDSTVQDSSLRFRFAVNGTPVGPTFNQSYVNSQNGATQSGVSGSVWLDLAADDVVTLQGARDPGSNSGAISMDTSGSSMFSLERFS